MSLVEPRSSKTGDEGPSAFTPLARASGTALAGWTTQARMEAGSKESR